MGCCVNTKGKTVSSWDDLEENFESLKDESVKEVDETPTDTCSEKDEIEG